ncbi:MAG: hypothetical protein V1887_04390 [Candidatus Aenigmatarchaeota archaeon]
MVPVKSPWPTRRWMGGSDLDSTSDMCSSHPQYDTTKCYDPLTHEVHLCEKIRCPFAYDEKAAFADEEKNPGQKKPP